MKALPIEDSSSWAEDHIQSEATLELALTDWLSLLSSTGAEQRRLSYIALERLALVLAKLHGDNWLHDLMAGAQTRLATRGLSDLAIAIEANISGNPEKAFQAAWRAEVALNLAKNRPGQLRARIEKVYALQRHIEPRKCLLVANSTVSELAGSKYYWADAQLALEQSVCHSMLGEFGAARAAADRGIAITANSNYSALHLRAIGIKASLDTLIGNTSTAWSEDQTGLSLYWEGLYPDQRAYQFYSDLSFAAQNDNRWFLAAALAKEAALTIGQTPNRSVEAIAWFRFGSLAHVAGLIHEAVAAFEHATSLFDNLPHNKTTQIYRLDCEVNLAAVEALQGNLEIPLNRLISIERDVLEVSDITIRMRFYQTLGTLQLQRRDYAQAEKAFRSVTSEAESGFHMLQGDRARLAWEQEVGKAYRGLVELSFLEQHDPPAALRLWRHYHELQSPQHQARISVSTRAPSDTITFTYAQLPDGIALWVIDRKIISQHWINTSAADLERLINRFSEDCSDPNTPLDLLKRDGYELYRILIEPAASQMNKTSLLFIQPDGVLKKIPMQALSDLNGDFLGADHPIVISQGAQSGSPRWASFAVDPGSRALIVGAPALAEELVSSFPPLSNALEEAEFVNKVFPHSTLLTKTRATLPAVQKALKRTEVFHFAGHAIFNSTSEGLLLAGSEPSILLDSQRLKRIHLSYCRLAILSACLTGRGEEGPLNSDNLVRAFLASGARGVIAPKWSIDSVETENFMIAFYTALQNRHSVPIALQEAARKLMIRPSTAHPYYWAAFNLYVSDP